jgi:hypothetical protein
MGTGKSGDKILSKTRLSVEEVWQSIKSHKGQEFPVLQAQDVI